MNNMEYTTNDVSWSTTDEEEEDGDKENENPYISAKKKLHVSFIPNQMVERESQFIKINCFLLDCINNQKPGSLYIPGVPGTGKTATFDSVVESVIRTHKDKLKYIPFNCVGYNTAKGLYSSITNLLCPHVKSTSNMKQDKLLEIIESHISKSRCQILLKIDEIDQINSLDILYRVFNWPNLPNSQLILVGIANEIALTDKLPKLKSYKVSPLLIPFDAYNKQQISNIIHHRLSPNHTELFDPKAIDYIASKATTSGDIRKALDICIQALDSIQEKYERHYTADSMCTVIPVKVGDVVPIIRNTFSSKEIGTIRCLPFHQKLILCCMVKFAKDREVDLQSVLEKYRHISISEDLPSVSTAEFLDMCQLISTTELVTLKSTEKKKNAPTSVSCRNIKVQVRVSEEDLIFAVSGETVLANIMTEKQRL